MPVAIGGIGHCCGLVFGWLTLPWFKTQIAGYSDLIPPSFFGRENMRQKNGPPSRGGDDWFDIAVVQQLFALKGGAIG